MSKPTVMIHHCPDYNVERIQNIALQGLDQMNLRPHGRTLLKPNVVASGDHFPHAYTRPEFTEGVLRALKERARPDTKEIAVGERCGITVPTRFAYQHAGYYPMARRVGGIKLYHFEEEPQVEVPFYHEDRLRDFTFTPEPIAKADFFVNCPKFKAHPWTTVTFSLKSYIGIQDDRHRLIDHDHKLEEKVADLQYIIQPQFIAIDGIIAGEGRMLTPIPFDLKLMIMGNNQVAFDVVCCHIIGVDPMSVPHIRLCYERGFGPADLSEINILGDVSLDEAKKRATGFRVGLIRVEDYFQGTNIQAYAGPYPGGKKDDYCYGGCPGAMEEAIEIMRLFDTQTDEKMPKTHIVFGGYDGEIQSQPGEKVVFIGDCTHFKGDIAGKPVEIQSVYKDRSTKNPREATAEDIFYKMFKMERKMWSMKKEDIVRITGCPVSVAEQVLLLIKLGNLKNPYFDPSQSLSFTYCYFGMRTRKLLNRIFGKPDIKFGPVERGDSRPHLNLPPEGADTPLEFK